MAGTKKTPNKQQSSADSLEYRLTVQGPMAGTSLSGLEERFTAELGDTQAKSIVLDITGVGRVDSRGIALCIGVFKECSGAGRSFRIEASGDVFRMFKILKLNRIMDIREGVVA